MSMSTTGMLRSTWRTASSSSRSSSFSTAIQPIAGPSRLRFTVPRCTCGEALLSLNATRNATRSNRNSRRWMSSTRIAYQSTSTIPQTSTTPPPPVPPIHPLNIDKNVPPPAGVEAPSSASITPGTDTSTATSASPTPAPRKAARPARREFKPQKAAISLTPTAVEQLMTLLDSPTPKLIRIGVRNKGCAGMAYHLEYVDKPGKFDEVIEQDGVKVLIDSKALFSIVGSEMDWQEDKISSKFVFKNPNIKEQCGCGESFLT